MRWKLLSFVALVFLLGLSEAFGRHVEVTDGNDRRGYVDVRRVNVYGKPPVWMIRTASWRPERIWDRGYLLVYFNTFGTRRRDYYALVRSNGRRMLGYLFRDRRTRRDYRISRLAAWHPTGRKTKVRVPVHRKMRFPKGERDYRWSVRTVMTGRNCKRACIDRVPDRGSIREPR